MFFTAKNADTRAMNVKDFSSLSISERFMSMICAILSNMAYAHSTQIFDDALLLELGLTLRYNYTTKQKSGDSSNIAGGGETKCMVFTKATPSELRHLKEIHEEFHPRLDPGSTSEWYLAKRKRHSALPYWKKNFIEWIRYLGVAGYISDQHLFVVFRGTDFNKASNILTDLQINTSSDAELCGDPVRCKFHSGFLNAYQTIYPHLKKVIRAYSERNCVVLTGHSLGASIASLMAFRLAVDHKEMGRHNHWTPYLDPQTNHVYYANSNSELRWNPALGLITFGSPRIATEYTVGELCKNYMSPQDSYLGFHLRIVNTGDLVTDTPVSIPRNRDSYQHLPIRRGSPDQQQCNGVDYFVLGKKAPLLGIAAKQFQKQPHLMNNYILEMLYHLPSDPEIINSLIWSFKKGTDICEMGHLDIEWEGENINTWSGADFNKQ